MAEIMRHHHDEGQPQTFPPAKVARGGGELFVFDGQTSLAAHFEMWSKLLQELGSTAETATETANAERFPAQFWDFATADDAYRFALMWGGRTDNHGQRADTPQDLSDYYRRLVDAGLLDPTDSGAFMELACCSLRQADRVTKAAREARRQQVDARNAGVIADLRAGNGTQREIAERYGISVRTVARAAKRARNMTQGAPAERVIPTAADEHQSAPADPAPTDDKAPPPADDSGTAQNMTPPTGADDVISGQTESQQSRASNRKKGNQRTLEGEIGDSSTTGLLDRLTSDLAYFNARIAQHTSTPMGSDAAGVVSGKIGVVLALQKNTEKHLDALHRTIEATVK
ncbi:MAG: hypothetical protein AAF515_10970 [Pseudomonadota bacterium]